ncbi:MAG: hypothetical protein ABJB09_04585 [Verrucomicrobiota bacterium]
MESPAAPQNDQYFAELIQQAEIFYFPTELLGPPVASEPAWKFLAALRRSGGSFALGWDLIGGEQQPLLEQWRSREISNDKFMVQIHFAGSVRERENCRAFLRETQSFGVRQLALRPPDTVGLSSEVALPQFAAEQIAASLSDHPDKKFVAFIHRRELDSARGVPYFVAQKTKVRQLVLDLPPPPSSPPHLLTNHGAAGLGRGFEVVDRAPRARDN